jgi:hypothetical protein
LLQEQIRIQNPDSDPERPKFKEKNVFADLHSGSSAFVTAPGSGMEKNPDPRYGTRDKHHGINGSYFRALSNNLLNKNTSILCEFRNADLDPGSGIRCLFDP